jgi:aspartyl-tRNA(Asn)/glutamyl-tRNA(Gln) amidotransferase subunit B
VTRFAAVIGLEVHCQLATLSKLFCGCANRFGAPPNTLACELCSGQPGALPVLNRDALDLALRAAVAFGCELAPRIEFDRKHYWYCDLPKGYQITQSREPLGRGGAVELANGKRVRLERVHLEEDAAKLLRASESQSQVDLNRAGVPLLECVTAPDLASAAEAAECLARIREILVFCGASECDMERGLLRCDVNVSLVATAGNARVELKNLNSFAHVHDAVEFELGRQSEALAAGRAVERETRAWDPERNETRALRGKETASDYRSLPEADLPPLQLDHARIERATACVPELPMSRRRRYHRELGLDPKLAEVLLESRASAEFFEATLRHSRDAREVSRWIANDVRALFAEPEYGLRSMAELPFKPFDLAELIELAASGRASRPAARDVLRAMCREPRAPRELLRELGLESLDEGPELDALCAQAIAAHADASDAVRAGNARALEVLLGAVMAASRSRANPSAVRARLSALLETAP